MDGAESTLVPGYRLDRYELLCPIASGGMATVWLARLRGKRGFEKLFAIKTIKTELISDPHFQEMFLDEARIASRILHPNVAQILELGEQDDILYIVMEYVDGDSVAKVHRLSMKRGTPLPPGVSLRIIADVCAGLHSAHQLKDSAGESLGVVHRDVSPQNILLTSGGAAKVIDFGLVKARNRSAAETGQGVVKGKIRYMAPEQVGGKSIDHRADVWAAGMCLYELITGHMPYHGEDDLDVVKRLMSDDPLPAFDLALPPQLEKILTRAIVRDPAARFETCAAMRRAIEGAIHELALPAESDDVAEFVKTTLPELSAKRSTTIAKAIEAADSRQVHTGSLEEPEPGDVAYAVTEVSGRDHPSSGDMPAMPLTRRRAEVLDSDPNRKMSSYGHSPSVTSLREQIGERKRRGGIGFWIAAFVVVGTAAWLLWPRVAHRETQDPTPTGSEPAPSSAALSAAPPPASIPVPATIELDPGPPEAGAPPIKPATSKPSTTRPSAPSTGAPPAAYDGGLSPGALSAAKIMLAPKPTETPPPAPPASEQPKPQ